MNIPKLQIQSTKAQIGINTTKPVQEIEQPKSYIEIQQPKAKMNIDTTNSRLTIDTTEARADLDLQSSIRRTAEVAQYSEQQAFEGLARRAEEGNELMRIENGGNPLAEQMKRRGRQPYSSLNVQFIPQTGSVKVNFEPATVDIRIEPQQVIIDSTINKPIHNYTPGKVKVEMVQYPSLNIDWTI